MKKITTLTYEDTVLLFHALDQFVDDPRWIAGYATDSVEGRRVEKRAEELLQALQSGDGGTITEEDQSGDGS